MFRYRSTLKRVVSGVLFCIFTQSSEGQQQSALTGELYAEAFNIVTFKLPDDRPVRHFGVSYSLDCERFTSLNAGLPRPGNLFSSIAEGADYSWLHLACVGQFRMGISGFLFDEPGKYCFKWEVEYVDAPGHRTTYVQEIEVLASRTEDRRFIERLGSLELLTYLMGDEWIQSLPESISESLMASDGTNGRALIIIAELLEMTRVNEPLKILDSDYDRETAIKWADQLWKIAKDIPDSSYAPYAAYFAGCCYSAISSSDAIAEVRALRVPGESKDKLGEAKQRFQLTHDDTRFKEGLEAFRFAVDRGDAYLQPLASYQQAFLLAMGGEFKESEEISAEVERSSFASRNVKKWTQDLTKEIRQFKEQAADKTLEK
ncbi:MAG TPA: hypothetical protein PKN33_17640 [Phycisphaerae bacterium]|nr:hypothetical protein [Phycisphaerae bacterium]